MLKILFIIAIFLNFGCKKEQRFYGYPNPDKIYANIKAGQTKDALISFAGEPSILDGKNLYYIRLNGTDSPFVSFIPNERIVTKIILEGNVIKDITFSKEALDLSKKIPQDQEIIKKYNKK